jgi:anti-sigma B factor antagonist
MHVSIDDAGMTAKVTLKGSFDWSGAVEAAPSLARLSEQKHGLIVDLSGVAFLASVGIRHLVQAAKTLTRRGGRLVLLRPSKAVEEVLTITGTNSLIPIAHDDREAQAVLAAALGG